MALLKRELHRQVKGPEITHADRCIFVFDTDTKRLYVESEVAHLEAKVGGHGRVSNNHNGHCGFSNARRSNRRSPRTMAAAEIPLQSEPRQGRIHRRDLVTCGRLIAAELAQRHLVQLKPRNQMRGPCDRKIGRRSAVNGNTRMR